MDLGDVGVIVLGIVVLCQNIVIRRLSNAMKSHFSTKHRVQVEPSLVNVWKRKRNQLERDGLKDTPDWKAYDDNIRKHGN